MVNSRKKWGLGFLWGCTVPLGNLAPISRFYYEHSFKSRSHQAAILKESEVFLFLGIIFFCSPQPYAVPSYKTVEGPSLDHSSLIEQKTLTLMQSLILPSNAQPATLVLAPNCLIKNVCRFGRWDCGIKVSARGVPIKLKGGFGHFCLHLKCP